ncbi:cytochrome P450 78A5 [Cajanus cajan]|uniref:Cytochrome P450 78A3 n=1 Tax=Cajanus cajan TaxID=3821 RepID=A0A151SPH0_CAJCA|nr:cytochrome P450 78A5 [Cajanus cajan]KYP56717.1 Cytochrome P450 78A3 [Cajanus cajan]
MSFELYSLFLPLSTCSTILSLDVLLGLLFFVGVLGYWLAPGGLAWALSKFRVGTALNNKASIPGPSGYPVVGLVPAFTGPLTHRVLAKLAQAFDAKHLMAFSVGFTRFIISSHPDTAKEILNSPSFADRPVKESAYELLFHRAMGFAPYGEYWRNLRRISATHMFSPRRIAASGVFRARVGAQMVRDITGLMGKHGEVEVRKVLHFGSLNNVMMSVFGRSYVFGEGGDGCELEELVSEGYDLLGVFNWSDHFPLLGRLDLQGVRKRCRNLVDRVNVFVGKIILEHRLKRAAKGENKVRDVESFGDFVDVLLEMEKESKLQHSDMVAILWEMIFRGTDTVAILLEWILARMVLHPEIQAKAGAEIDSIVGCGRNVSDDDLPNLPYVRGIVKEALRMHPPGPLLSWARLSIHDTHIGNHFVPAGTTAMVNMWAITHDQEVWSEPEVFKPERFVDVPINIMGSDLRLAPFGSGRRVCPGKAMGLATVELWLAMLLHNFEWMPPDSSAVVDLSECLKLSMEMKRPLLTKPIPRLLLAAATTASASASCVNNVG